jgi:hypothetical protein
MYAENGDIRQFYPMKDSRGIKRRLSSRSREPVWKA